MRDTRTILLLVFLLLGFVILSLRLGSVVLLAEGDTHAGSIATVATQEKRRGRILDRNGEVLAVDTLVPSVSANPRAVWNAEAAAYKLGPVIGVTPERLRARLEKENARFVWIARDITPAQKQAILDTGVEGLNFHNEFKRAYPYGHVLGHILGQTDIDGKGLAGLERSYNDILSTEDIQLTVDIRIQSLIERALIEGQAQYQAKAGAAILLDRDGAILAMASVPSFDPNKARTFGPKAIERINQASASVYELGSVIKPLTIAQALTTEVVSAQDLFQTSKPYALGPYTIRDTHPSTSSPSSLKTIIQESSNIGVLEVYSKLQADAVRDMTIGLGFDSRVDLALPERAMPLTPPDWSEIHAGSVAYGHGLSLSPLHMALAYTVFTNSGNIRRPYLRIEDKTGPVRRIFSAKAVETILPWLAAVVMNGTAKRAQNSGYIIGGKTGTADLPVAGGYDPDRNICSFAAVFPLSDPRYILLVTLVEPEATSEGMGRTAGWNAAPLAADMIRLTGPILGLYAPNTPSSNLQDTMR